MSIKRYQVYFPSETTLSSQPSNRLPLLRLLEINPNLPIDIKIPVIPLRSPIRVETVKQWLEDERVRQALQNVIVNVRHFHEDLGIPRAQDLDVFNNEATSDYIDYIDEVLIPAIMRLPQPTRGDTRIIRDTLRRLRRIVKEDFPLTKSDIRRYIQAIYPRSHFIDMPAMGNCYFCAIGAGLDIPEDQIRHDIANYAQNLMIQNLNAYRDFISQNLQGCPKDRGIRSRETRYQEFPQEIHKSCHQGDVDCINCLWGGNSYDPTIADLYHVPVIGMITSTPDSKTINLDLSITLPSDVTNPRQYVATYRGPIASYLGDAVGSHYDYLELD